MTKDYKDVSEAKTSAARSKKKPQKEKSGGTPGWVWLLGGIVIGGFISFLVYLKTNISHESNIAKSASQIFNTNKSQDAKPSTQESEEERFKFYDILPNRTVKVPDEEIVGQQDKTDAQSKSQSNASRPSQTSSTSRFVYELQAGSFFQFKDADKRKANLALLGIQARIQSVKTRENKSLYRVRIGPYDNIAKINEIENLLNENRIKSLLIRIRG